jgi:TolA-binding protein
LKRLVVFLVTTALLAVAGSAGAAPRPTRAQQLKQLEASIAAAPTTSAKNSPAAQIKTLQKQVGTLQKQVKLLTNALEADFVYDECLTAVTADAFQSTWVFADKEGTPFFPATSITPQVDDKKACSDLQIARPAVTDQTPPSQAIFQALIDLIG